MHKEFLTCSLMGLMAICCWFPWTIRVANTGLFNEPQRTLLAHKAVKIWTNQGKVKWKQTWTFIFLTHQLQTKFHLINHEMIHRVSVYYCKSSWVIQKLLSLLFVMPSRIQFSTKQSRIYLCVNIFIISLLTVLFQNKFSCDLSYWVSDTEQNQGVTEVGMLEVSGPVPVSPCSKQMQHGNRIRLLIIEHEGIAASGHGIGQILRTGERK